MPRRGHCLVPLFHLCWAAGQVVDRETALCRQGLTGCKISQAEPEVQVTHTCAFARSNLQLTCYTTVKASTRRRRELRNIERVLACQKGSDHSRALWPLHMVLGPQLRRPANP